MKATLTFDLPEETDEHETALNGWKYLACLQDIQEHVRKLVKYKEMSSPAHNEVLGIRDKLTEILNSRGVELYK